LLKTDNLQNQRVIRSIPEFPEWETEEMMDTVVVSVAEKRLLFLGHCLEILEDDLYGKNEDKKEFCRRCLGKLAASEKLHSKELRDCDINKDEDQKRGDKTYRAWLNDLAIAIDENRYRLEADLDDYDLKTFPKIERFTGGGKNNEGYFFIDVANAAVVDTQLTAQTFDDSALPQRATLDDQHQYDSIRYSTEKISRPPWYLKLAALSFRTKTSRGIMLLSLLFILFLFLPVLTILLVIIYPLMPSMVALIGLLILIYLLIASPAFKIIRLVMQKIVVVNSIRLPLSSVCISEITKVLPEDGTATERHLSVVTVSADCPICDHKYGLKKSVLLEQEGVFGKRIIGECLNNPIMHRFTFDKDLMAGDRIFSTRHG
jgi:hypothetical protein